MAPRSKPQGLSITTMTTLVGIVVAYLMWGVATAMYDTAGGGRWVLETQGVRRPSVVSMAFAGVIAFVVNSVMFLPELPQVIGFVLTQRTWFAIVVVIVEAGVVGFGIGMARLQETLDSGQLYKKK